MPENPAYTFETFVSGKNARSAVATCVAVSRSPGRVHNPLFIHGPTCSGKTHLLHAIEHAVRRRDANVSILQISTRALADRVLEAAITYKTEAFVRDLAEYEVLLTDDLPKLRKMTSTLEEVGRCFCELIQRGVQVVATSTTSAELKVLAAHLPRDREPVVVGLQYPDLASRLKIARSAAAKNDVQLSDRELRAVARTVRSTPAIRAEVARIAFVQRLNRRP